MHSRIAIEIATQAWIAAYRRECVRRNVAQFPSWDDLDGRDRAAMMACVAAALKAADPQNVEKVIQRRAEMELTEE